MSEKKVFIKTYGCQMNVYDSERMAESLAEAGYGQTDRADEADLILLNTCHIREKASEKVYSELGRLKPLKAARPGLKVGVVGCVAQAEGAEIIARQPLVDVVAGPQAYQRLPDLLAATPGQVATDFAVDEKFARLPKRASHAPRPTAFLTVQEGCDKFCTFCVVPYTRGAEVSRPAERILEEARALAEGGVRELTLLGQNVNAYAGPGPDGTVWSLARLIRALAEIEGLDRLRYTTSHPRDMSEDLIAAHAEVPALMPYLHLPVQSGSDTVLKAMNRGHRATDYLRLVDRIRAARPDIALSGDFIVGFPGETDADFDATLALVDAVSYASAFSFKYSARPGTPAAERSEIPEAVKAARLAQLQDRLAAQQAAFQASMVGQQTSVLLEKPGRLPGQLVGRSPYLQPVHLDAAPEALGRILPVEITGSGPNSLSARAL